MRAPNQQSRLLAVAAAVAMLVMPLAAEAQTKVKSGFNLFSPQQDVEIGTQSAAQVEQQMPVVRNEDVQAFVDSIGQRLAREAGGPDFRYRFRVVNASDLNAFALPGGYIYLNRGIIESAKNEGEVAGVLAHEIAHVALRHGTHNASKAYLTQAGLGILGGLLGGKVGSNTAQIINTLGGFGLNAIFLKYTREAEKDADVYGAQMLARAGYSPVDMASFFQTLAKTDKRRTVSWLSSHPAPENRINRINQEARLIGASMTPSSATSRLRNAQASLRRLGSARTTEELARMRSATRTPTRSARSGDVRAEAPSRQMRTYTSRGRVYQVQYPANWQVYGEGSNAVTIGPRGGVIESGNRAEVVYGAIVSHYDPFGNETRRRSRRPRSVTVETATDDLIAQIRQASPHLGVVRGSGRRFRLAGGVGLGATLRGQSPVTGLRERVTIVTRQLHDGHLIYMLFITPERDAAAYQPVMNAMISSMRIDEDRHH